MADITVRQFETGPLWSMTLESPQAVSWGRDNIPQWRGTLGMSICGSKSCIDEMLLKAMTARLSIDGAKLHVTSYACLSCGQVHAAEGGFKINSYECRELGPMEHVDCLDRQVRALLQQRVQTAGHGRRARINERIDLLKAEKLAIVDGEVS